MPQFYFIFLGMYLYYSKSKYYPDFLFSPRFRSVRLFGLLFTIAGSLLYVRADGWAGGLLLALAASMLAMGMVQLFAVLGKYYFYGMAVVIHVLLLIQLICDAS
ncbi:hypothetical protein MUK70_15920 [Dyadobacter chenwenxiniae]|uniref:Uncharacterized protein n=1 Tax=Dyadobacter chenwenxiniae TaxID=2906456 RepID=A0A9X1TDI8_9BACT|nr:hypothetical protein [Dyadobacter chenwenxiniae]MCF0060729.1 hypothetical protein [Dyadobacter chenwenxiniae]UON80563.1 hypothetical protein MUK70_15920 [Dyadobacter chenwenxiniae]